MVFIALEGVDGSGKSTQARLLCKWAEERGMRPLLTREPGGTPLGLALREIVLGHTEPITPMAEALIFAADKAEHVATLIAPAIADGRFVITDRYVDSAVAYQGAGRRLGTETVRMLNMIAVGGLTPDLTVVLDVEPRAAHGRAVAGGADRIESEGVALQQRVRAELLRCVDLDPSRYVVISGEGSRELVHARVIEAVHTRLRTRTAA